MNIGGVGIDIVEVSRFARFREDSDDGFIKRCFTDEESRYCYSYSDPAPHLAGTFAAKEAAFKACGDARLGIESFEISRDADGKPLARIKDGADQRRIDISISHTEHTAVAVAISYV